VIELVIDWPVPTHSRTASAPHRRSARGATGEPGDGRLTSLTTLGHDIGGTEQPGNRLALPMRWTWRPPTRRPSGEQREHPTGHRHRRPPPRHRRPPSRRCHLRGHRRAWPRASRCPTRRTGQERCNHVRIRVLPCRQERAIWPGSLTYSPCPPAISPCRPGRPRSRPLNRPTGSPPGSWGRCGRMTSTVRDNVTCAQRPDLRADLLAEADGRVADPERVTERVVPAVARKVRSADAGGEDLPDAVGRLREGRVRLVLEPDVAAP
jgi:hypothetical protein